jgi:hypothetical protein
MPQAPQTLKNHTRLLPPYHFFVIPVLLINFLAAIWNLYRMPSGSTAWALVVAAALLCLATVTRTMALTVQNRVIRLEMRHRLREALPPDLLGRSNELTPQQLIALRFAGDDELAALVREVLTGNLTTQKAIKQRVTNWQADYLRC